MASLDARYFAHVVARDIDDSRYDVYQNKDSPLVLMSKTTGEPLAALTLRTQMSYTGKTVVWKRDGDGNLADFQGLCDKDNQEIEFVITNLCNKGMINFNILRNATAAVNQVNPGPLLGVNQVNELHPRQSFAVQCDQKDNMALFLSAAGGTTVAQDQATSGGSRASSKATYYYLSVVPEQGVPEQMIQFADTVWVCTDTLVLKAPVPPVREAMPVMLSVDEEEEEDSMGYDIFDSIGAARAENCTFGASRGVMKPESSRQTTSRGGDETRRGYAVKYLQTTSRGGDETSRGYAVKSCQTTSRGGDETSRGYAVKSRQKGHSALRTMSSLIETSKVATVGTSGRRVAVNSAETGKEYNYALNSPPCVLTLSVQPLLRFTNNILSLVQADELLAAISTNHYKSLIETKMKVFPSDECVVCLEDAPDMVLFGCGHQCLHKGCMTATLVSCPLCRGNITATLVTA